MASSSATEPLAQSVTTARALFSALRDPAVRTDAGCQRVRELEATFERQWEGVSAAAIELDSEQEQLSSLREERSRLREVDPTDAPIGDASLSGGVNPHYAALCRVV